MSCEVLVIGEGLSGIVAAATAARQGSRVTLASKGPGNFVLGSGCIDLDGLDRGKIGLIDDGSTPAVSILSRADGLGRMSHTAEALANGDWFRPMLGASKNVSLAPRWLWQADPH